MQILLNIVYVQNLFMVQEVFGDFCLATGRLPVGRVAEVLQVLGFSPLQSEVSTRSDGREVGRNLLCLRARLSEEEEQCVLTDAWTKKNK
jgi:hypothetical protein